MQRFIAFLILWLVSIDLSLSFNIYNHQKLFNFRLHAFTPSEKNLDWFGSSFKKFTVAAIIASASMTTNIIPAHARPEGVNRPDLLPSEKGVALIDVANFLSKGQEKKAIASISELEKRTGLKLRVLCQSYPNTPGLAIKDYWGVDDNTIVLVADRGDGFNRKGIPSNLINLNIGKNVEFILPNQFWQRLTNKLGNQPYIKANGEDIAVLNTIEAITYCLEDKNCVDLPFNL